ncbi:MAG: hypothetical protein R3A13_06730 [Bdellovibrionota bacterium]
MINADQDLNQDALNPELHKNKNEPPKVEAQINLNDASFTPAARGLTLNSENIGKEFEAYLRVTKQATQSKLLEILKSGKLPTTTSLKVNLAGALTESLVIQTLKEFAAELENPELKKYFLDPTRTEMEMLGIVEYLNPDKRKNFTQALITLSAYSKRALEFIADKLDNIINQTPINERVELIKRLLNEKDNGSAPQIIAKILKSSANLSELSQIVAACGEKNLLAQNNRQINEYLAHVQIGLEIRKVLFPQDLPLNASQDQISKHLLTTQKALEKIIKICKAAKTYAETDVVKDFLFTATEDLKLLAHDLEEFSGDLAKLRTLANINARKSELEFKYGVNITRGAGEELDHDHNHQAGCYKLLEAWLQSLNAELETEKKESRWTEKDIKDIGDVLSRIPEGHLLFTPMLRDIEIVNTLGEYVLGARYHKDGRIKIAAWTINHPGMTVAYDGQSALSIVLAHEIGHGIQIADGPAGLWKRGEEYLFGTGEAGLDFDEYTALSGWKVYNPNTYSYNFLTNKITIGDKSYPLDKAVEFNGKQVVFNYNPSYNILMSYNASAEFTERDYSRASPWEDFAEAFAEYLYLPERIISRAPDKFMHLEREFGKYKANQHIKEYLKETLKAREDAKKWLEELINSKQLTVMTKRARAKLNMRREDGLADAA